MLQTNLRIQKFTPNDLEHDIFELVTTEGKVLCDVSINESNQKIFTFGIGVDGNCISINDIVELLKKLE
jgi:hypothetical protein